MAKHTHTPGPWAWYGNAGSKSLQLATTHSGRRFVMQFARWGMSGAQPRFQVDSRMVDASTLLCFEVCHAIGVDAAKADTSCYRLDVNDIDHPDARLIAAAPDMLEALEDARAELDISTLEHEEGSAAYNALKSAIAKIDAAIAKATK